MFATECALHDVRKEEEEQNRQEQEKKEQKGQKQERKQHADRQGKTAARSLSTPLLTQERIHAIQQVFRMIRRQERRRLRNGFKL